MDTDRFLRLPEVENLIGLRSSQIYLMIKGGEFPRSIKIGGASRWSLRAVTAWMDECARAA